VSAVFNSCTFRQSKLNKVDFEGSSFANCVFEGLLEEVAFARESLGESDLPPNEMLNVDFSRAELLWVSFRGLNLENVTFPMDDKHIILEDYPKKLGLLINFLKKRSDGPSKAYANVLQEDRKRMGPKQRRGILNEREILESGGGPEFLESVLSFLQSIAL